MKEKVRHRWRNRVNSVVVVLRRASLKFSFLRYFEAVFVSADSPFSVGGVKEKNE